MASINSQYSGRAELAEQYKAQQAEKEELQAAHETEINQLKKSYALERADLADRFESSTQSEKLQHYDHLRNLKTQMTREERALEDTRNRVVNQKSDDLHHDELTADRDGRDRVKNAIEKYAAAEDFERQKALRAENEIRTDHRKSAELLIGDSQKRLDKLAEEKSTYLDDQKTTHAKALDEIKDHYLDSRAQTEKQYASEAANVEQRANQELNAKRLTSSSALHAFDEKNQDPFYQIKRFESDLLDIGDSFVLRVKVPEYERKQFKVEVSGQGIQLKGVRSSDENAKLEPGRSVSTRAYQAISERYSLGVPVDGKSMSYIEDGEWLEYHIPKFGPGHRVGEARLSLATAKEDAAIGKELSFKDSLPTPANSAKGRNTTLS